MAGNSTESGRSVTSKITSILLTFTEGSDRPNRRPKCCAVNRTPHRVETPIGAGLGGLN